MTPPARGAVAPARFDRLDALRGAAIVWMAAFHFAFDLDHYGFLAADFRHDAFWTVQRTCIVSLFLFCAGVGQAIAYEQRQPWRRFAKRWAQVAGCAVLVSIGSRLMFPASWISFGVLHGIAAMLVVTRWTAGWGAWLWPLGLVAIALPHALRSTFFDAPWTAWVGFVTRRPVTEDYVPIFPWLGAMWWGVAAGRLLLGRRARVLAGALPRALRPLAALGRWSLSFYMLHQPVLIGALLLATLLRR